MPEVPTFNRDVLPILEGHCQGCHRPGEMAPMPLLTYVGVRPYARAIRQLVSSRTMPPWFADSCCGHFSNDPSLSSVEIATIREWADNGAPEGASAPFPQRPLWTAGWKINKPDLKLSISRSIRVPAEGEIPYQYIILPTHLKNDRWVRMAEIRPGNPAVVHHAVAYIRGPRSEWLRGAPVGTPFSAGDLPPGKLRADAMWTTNDILLVYAPGSSPDNWPEGFAKLLPAGSDIVLQLHYTTRGAATTDSTQVGMTFSEAAPSKRVLTLQLTNDRFLIPPGDPSHRVEVHGTLPNNCLLLSFFPHMHLRGKSFEYNLTQDGTTQTLLRVPHYDFFWQLSYRLAAPLAVKAGSTLQAIATFDNSRNNPHNPDPDSAVRWGEQTSEEMMVGFFDVAVDAPMGKEQFFVRHAR